MANQWRASGMAVGDIVLVHSSIGRILRKAKAELYQSLGPDDILQSLIDAISESGTLILPLFNFDFAKGIPFDVRTTPSQMGVLTEQGRLFPGAVRTGHPIYSFAAIGKEREQFRNIDNYSGYGPDSPFAKLMELNGKIGVIDLADQNSMTSYHFVEEANDVPYRFHKKFRGEYTGWDGVKRTKEYGLFVRKLDEGVQTDVNRMMEKLWTDGLYAGSKPGVGYGMRTIPIRVFFDAVNAVIKRGDAIHYLYSIQKAT